LEKSFPGKPILSSNLFKFYGIILFLTLLLSLTRRGQNIWRRVYTPTAI